MNVLSLFDGMSVGMLALKNLGIKVDNYYASEIDKYAISVSKYNFPEIKHVGDVKNVWYKNGYLNKSCIAKNGKFWKTKIDLLIGGSPCQGFSFAGKQLNFDDPRSKLFFEFVRILRETKPKYFLLENVKMKKEYQDIISKELGVEPIEINSSLVSAQSRKRLYWTNIQSIKQPEDKKIYLEDVLENGEVDREKSYCIDYNYFKGGNLKNYFEKSRRQLVFDGLVKVGEVDLKGMDCVKRVYDPKGKCPTLTTMGGGHREPKIITSKTTWRKLTPIECERLQTLPDNYTEKGLKNNKIVKISNTQRYKMLGNGWTCKVIEHIFKNLKND